MGHKTKTKAMSLGKQLVSMGLIDRDEEEMRRWEGREDFKYVMIMYEVVKTAELVCFKGLPFNYS
jgi:predicted transcriptional regulator